MAHRLEIGEIIRRVDTYTVSIVCPDCPGVHFGSTTTLSPGEVDEPDWALKALESLQRLHDYDVGHGRMGRGIGG